LSPGLSLNGWTGSTVCRTRLLIRKLLTRN